MILKPIFPHPPHVRAKYTPQEVRRYQGGHPLIEALPPINDPKDIASVLYVHPIIEPDELDLPAHIRMHCVQSLKDWMVPRPAFFQAEQLISMMIRQAYLGRNPLHPSTMRMLYALGKRDITELKARIRKSNLAGAAMLDGLSGVGKSTMLEALLSLYPQVITHRKYDTIQFYQTQLTYLIVPCPSGASPRALCLEFFRAVDEVCGTNYYKTYAKSRHNPDILLIEMALIAATFHIGILIIDEVQNLRAARSARRAVSKGKHSNQKPQLSPKGMELMNFFVKLVNWVGIPVIFVGTGDVMPLFDETMQYVRRATGDGDISVEPIPRGSDEWFTFLAELLKYQWLRSPLRFNVDACKIPGSQEAAISDKCHYLTCGIPDVVVKLSMQSQWLALRSNRETMDVALLEETYDTALRALHPSLDSLRAGGDDARDGYERHYPDKETLDALSSAPVDPAPISVTTAENNDQERAATNEKTESKGRNPPVEDLPVQFNVKEKHGDTDTESFDLRTVSGAPDAVRKIREAGLVFDITKIA